MYIFFLTSSLTTMLAEFIHVTLAHSFLQLHRIPVCKHNAMHLPALLLTDIWECFQNILLKIKCFYEHSYMYLVLTPTVNSQCSPHLTSGDIWYRQSITPSLKWTFNLTFKDTTFSLFSSNITAFSQPPFLAAPLPNLQMLRCTWTEVGLSSSLSSFPR